MQGLFRVQSKHCSGYPAISFEVSLSHLSFHSLFHLNPSILAINLIFNSRLSFTFYLAASITCLSHTPSHILCEFTQPERRVGGYLNPRRVSPFLPTAFIKLFGWLIISSNSFEESLRSSKMQFTKLLVATAAFAVASAQTYKFTDSSFSGITVGQAFNITWEPATDAVTIKLKTGPSTAQILVSTIVSKSSTELFSTIGTNY